MHRRTFLSSAVALGFAAGCGKATPAPTIPEQPPPSEPAPTGPPARTLRLPPRSPSARGARVFLQAIAGLGAADRENATAAELLAGNVPAFVRQLVPLRLGPPGEARALYTFVTPDYLCLGSDDDFVRVAITMRSARKVARRARATPPTRALVDAIYAAAAHRIASPTMSPGSHRPADVLAHNDVIQRRLETAGGRAGELVAGSKKDIVLSKRMLEHGGRTALYGWMLKDGTVVQPLSLVHDDRFVDYAQGLRLVDRRLWIDGRDVDLLDALADRELAPLISDEGAHDLRVMWERGW